jgi:cytoskeleton protein RodZ
MESLGQILLREREKRGYSLDHVSRETNISRAYLEALEKENFAAFPGEPYLFGFLRNYAEYLELSADELMTLYRNYKIQEQPSPMEKLLPPAQPLPLRAIVFAGVIVVLGLLLVLGWGDLVSFFQEIPNYLLVNRSEEHEAKTYTLEKDAQELERRFFQGDKLEIKLNNNDSTLLEIAQLDDYVLIVSPNSETKLRLGQEAFLDLDEDNSMDVRVSVTDMDPRNPKIGANLSFQRIENVTQITTSDQILPGNEAPVVISTLANVRPERQRPSVLVQTAPNPSPFQVEIVFRGRTMLRYQADERPREEGFWDKGEVLKIDVVRQVVLGVSNANAFSIRINDKELDLNTQDQVIVRVLRWVQSRNEYQLRLDPVY